MTRILPFLGGLIPLVPGASSSAPVSGAPDNFTVYDYLKHFTNYYCPFEVDGAVTKDLSQLVVTYDLSKPGKPFPGPGHEMDCLFRIQYFFNPGDNEYRFTEIEHSGAEKVDLQVSTKTVFDQAYGPVSVALQYSIKAGDRLLTFVRGDVDASEFKGFCSNGKKLN
jgi:hypothetical protein